MGFDDGKLLFEPVEALTDRRCSISIRKDPCRDKARKIEESTL